MTGSFRRVSSSLCRLSDARGMAYSYSLPSLLYSHSAIGRWVDSNAIAVPLINILFLLSYFSNELRISNILASFCIFKHKRKITIFYSNS